MKISLNWLREYVDFRCTPEELAERLTMAGLEVETVENPGKKYEGFVVGEILDITNHPNADRLTVCRVNAGKQVLKIVCGAPNVSVGQKVAVGLVGATVPRSGHGNGDNPFVLGRAEIRGEISEGVICSAYELGLGEDSEGILDLGKDARVGTPLAEHLGLSDTVLDIGVTPNRPDCLSHVGVGREAAAFLGKKLKFPKFTLKETAEHVGKVASVEVQDRRGCPRYCARVVRNVSVHESPKWMRDRLGAVGIRPINCIVDITNYVLMELGHPLHAFDYDKLQDQTVIVRGARQGEHLTTLDGIERVLKEGMLLICDRDKPVAVAGVMGGSNTEITDATRNVFIESAYFHPASVRRTSKQLGLSTEASQRFERGADPNMTTFALERAAQLMSEVGQGRVLKGMIDRHSVKFPPERVALRVGRTNEILGTALSKNDVIRLLSKLEIPLTRSRASRKTDTALSFLVPTFRPDIKEEIDLIEEIARVYGYGKIETKLRGHVHFSEDAPSIPLENALREWLAAGGYHEIVANSMQDKTLASLSGEDHVEVLNPASKDIGALRTSLVPGALQIIAHNLDHSVKDLRLFELGKVFSTRKQSKARSTGIYLEENRLLLVLSGKAVPTHWGIPGRFVDFFDVKGELEALFSKIFLDKVKFIYYSTSKTLTDLAVGIEINKTYLGYVGRVSEKVKALFDIKQDVFVGEISVNVLQGNLRKRPGYKPLPKYPAVVRDLAFVVDENQPAGELVETMWENGGDLVQGVELFDVYVGDRIEAGKKSCAFTLQLMSTDHTLTDKEIEDRLNQIVSAVASRFQATLRTL